MGYMSNHQRRITLCHKAVDRSFADHGLCLDAAMAGLGVALSNPSLHPLFRDMKARWALENGGEQTDWIWVRNSESCRLHIHEYPT